MTERLVEENVTLAGVMTHPESADSRMQYESLDHPYTLVDMYNFHAILRAQNGTEFGVSQAVGRTILALAIGAEHGKTRQEISKDVHSESPERVISHVYIRELIRKARIATIGLGPPIITSNKTYYFKNDLPEQRLNDFEGWGEDSLTKVRFDMRTSYLTILRDGVYQETLIEGATTKALLEVFLRYPSQSLNRQFLNESMAAMGYDIFVYSRSIASFRAAMKRRLGDNFTTLFSGYSDESGSGSSRWKLYVFHVDSAEIIGKDGSKQVYTAEPFVENIEEGVAISDASYVALGLLIKGDSIRRYLPLYLQAQWPQQTDLKALSEATTFPNSNSVQQLVKATESLERIKAFLDQPDVEERIRNWSPDDGRVKSLVHFLEAFDKVVFTTSHRQQIKGIDALMRMLLY